MDGRALLVYAVNEGWIGKNSVSGIELGDIKIDAGREPSAALSDCVQRKVVRWKFPRPRDGQPVAITYPFVFATIEDR